MSDLHYKKDGSLDMRYASSRNAVSSSNSGPSVSSTTPASSGYGSRMSSASSNTPSVSAPAPTPAAVSAPSSDLHYKKDGTLDMRYTSSQNHVNAGGSTSGPSNTDNMHYKKDGTLDMRYNTSQNHVAGGGSAYANHPNGSQSNGAAIRAIASDMEKLKVRDSNTAVAKPGGITKIVDGVTLHLKKDGSLDMRYKVNQQYLERKDASEKYNARAREEYWQQEMREATLLQLWSQQRNVQVKAPEPDQHFTERDFRSIKRDLTRIVQEPSADIQPSLPVHIKKVPDGSLDFRNAVELGKGAFGVVSKIFFDGHSVAVKRLHSSQMTKSEKRTFQNEIVILSQLSSHPNLVKFHGYSLDPPCIIMELVELGSLSYLLHYCTDKAIEMKIADGRVKKNLLIGIADGMTVLHEVEVVHGDLKPQNILVSKNFEAKITDFGLAQLRGKASAMVETSKMVNDDANAAGGTGAYMAPELLNSSDSNSLESDVYSFGVSCNEVVTEEEPYMDQYKNFAGKGPFAAVNYARLGNRPRTRSGAVAINDLIQKCWNQNAQARPKFRDVAVLLRSSSMVVPNGPGL